MKKVRKKSEKSRDLKYDKNSQVILNPEIALCFPVKGPTAGDKTERYYLPVVLDMIIRAQSHVERLLADGTKSYKGEKK